MHPIKSLGVAGLVTIRHHGLRLLTLNNEAVGLMTDKVNLPHLEGIVYVGLRSLLAAKKTPGDDRRHEDIRGRLS